MRSVTMKGMTPRKMVENLTFDRLLSRASCRADTDHPAICKLLPPFDQLFDRIVGASARLAGRPPRSRPPEGVRELILDLIALHHTVPGYDLFQQHSKPWNVPLSIAQV